MACCLARLPQPGARNYTAPCAPCGFTVIDVSAQHDSAMHAFTVPCCRKSQLADISLDLLEVRFIIKVSIRRRKVLKFPSLQAVLHGSNACLRNQKGRNSVS